MTTQPDDDTAGMHMAFLSPDVTDEQLDAILEKLEGNNYSDDEDTDDDESKNVKFDSSHAANGEFGSGGGDSYSASQISAMSPGKAGSTLVSLLNANNGNFTMLNMLGTQAIKGYAVPAKGKTTAAAKGKAGKAAVKKAVKKTKAPKAVALTWAQKEQKLLITIHKVVATFGKAKNEAAAQKAMYTLSLDLGKMVKLQLTKPKKAIGSLLLHAQANGQFFVRQVKALGRRA